MASQRKYAALPDLDSAPDIYETPELTDDNSTVPPTTGPSYSENGSDDGDDHLGISRARLRVDNARARFMPSEVDAREVDFSDRLDGKRKSYRTSTRRRRVLPDGTEELGDLTDEEDDDSAESLARKIARLRREIVEAKEQHDRQKATAGDGTTQPAGQDEAIASLSQALEELSSVSDASRLATLPSDNSLPPQPTVADDTGVTASSTYTLTYAPNYEQVHTLAKAADFDRRLVMLEKTLGIGSSAMPELDAHGLPRAILPTLEGLHKQISTLSDASTTSLDTISRKVRALTQEAEALDKARKNAKAAQEALASTSSGPVEGELLEESEHTAKINALYGTLPTIDSLAPLLPPLLDRLRSLRVIHANAASASETLERLETRQADMANDIVQWREGLEKVEAAMKEGALAMTGNMETMEGMVKQLEDRMAKLS